MSDDRMDVTITDQTKVTLGWVVALLGGTATLVTSIVLWAAHIANTSALTADEVTSVRQDVTQLRNSVDKIREAQIRMETRMGLSPSYQKPKEEGR